jgi:acrylyl-CoA reductase (NADPH)
MEAFVVDKPESGFTRGVVEREAPACGDGEVLVRVEWSGLNYKDGLAALENGKVVRDYPLVCGVDLAGTVVESCAADVAVDAPVIAHGYALGVARDGGLAEYCAVPGEWIVPLPATLSARNAMVAGTAGFTAARCVMAVAAAGEPSGPVLVTGATGGVGSFAVAMLANLGYEVVASTGRTEREGWLKSLGAAEVIDRLPAEVKPLEKERWAGVVDTVGGTTLAAAIAATRYNGVVTACGNTGGITLETTVFPFILRGVSLVGIDSVNVAAGVRRDVWRWLADHVTAAQFDALAGREIELSGVADALDEVLAGKAEGRTLVRLGS